MCSLRKNEIFKRGQVKICIPLMGKTKDEIVSNLIEIINYPVDIIEWRADHYENALDGAKSIDIINTIKEIEKNIPILYTFRTSNEGGEMEISKEKYKNLLMEMVTDSQVDMVDVEYMMGEDVVGDIVETAKQRNVVLIGSNHDFEKTPETSVIYDRLLGMYKAGLDVSKIAVMPQNKMDVIRLLEATAKINEDYDDIFTITMSMGEVGAVSRIIGSYFGSVMTFGAAGKSSAPGQIDAKNLRDIMVDIKNNIEKIER